MFKMFKDKKFMAHVYCGDPSLEFSEKLIDRLINSGVEMLELGIPFNDPLADGRVFHQACQRALSAGVKAEDVFNIAKKFSCRIPIVLTTYYNIIFRIGIKKFVQKCKESSVSGLIVPDLPYEESFPLLEECRKREIHLIYLIAPNTNYDRMRKILSVASGFVYLVSLSGVTGSNKKINIKDKIAQIRLISSLPIFAGFGIKSKDDVKNIMDAGADGFIIGSEICRRYCSGEGIGGVKEFIESLKILSI